MSSTTINILKEIHPGLINKGKELLPDNFDNFIQQNKLFLILFYSQIIFSQNTNNNNEFLQTFFFRFSNISENFPNIKFIICLCDEEKEDYDLSKKYFSKFSCLIIPFESEGKKKLIDYFNIISLPCLLFLDKDGKKLDSLGGENEILEGVDDKKVEGWLNFVNISEMFKRRSGGYLIGDFGKVECHRHVMCFADYRNKSSGYSTGNWYCDSCSKRFNKETPNFYCHLCDYDLCNDCYEKYKI